MIALQIGTLILINLAVVHCFSIFQFKNLNENDFVEKISDIMEENDHSEEHENSVYVRSRKNLNELSNTKKRLLVSILPHESKLVLSGPAVYRPLMRIHKKKTIYTQDNDKKPISRSESKVIGKKGKEMVLKLHNKTEDFNFDDIWEKFKLLKDKKEIVDSNSNKFMLLRSLKKLSQNRNEKILDDDVERVYKPNLRFTFELDTGKAKEKFNEFWKRFKGLITKPKEKRRRKKRYNLLRFGEDHLKVRSGEEHDPLAPGKLPYNFDLEPPHDDHKHHWMPKYPFWNYWTYDKTLHQDNCRGKLVKVGHKCIGAPPH